MLGSFDHFLITRFNLFSPEPNWQEDKHAQATLTQTWLEHRINLFINYCLPSVANQVNQNFKWLLLLSAKTPTKHISLLEKKISLYKNYNILLINEEVNFTKEVINYIHAHKSTATHCMTTRLDNDDLLSRYAINEIQNNFQGQSNYCINLKQGLMLKIEGKNILTKVESPASPFITYVEAYNEFPLRTVFSQSHSSFGHSTKIIQINQPLWLQLVHNRNLINELKGKPVFKVNDRLEHYNIKESEVNISYMLTIRYIIKKIFTLLSKKIKKVSMALFQ